MSLLPMIRTRRSLRSFDPSVELADDELSLLVEAARWAPSAMNRQPWRFLVARRGSDAFAALHHALAQGNQVWADKAAALLVALVDVEDEGAPTDAGRAYEVGLAVGQLGVQAEAMGLVAHQMGGFSAERVSEAFDIPGRYRPMVVIAVGPAGDSGALPDQLRVRETAPRTRLDASEIAFEDVWGRGILELRAADPAA